MHTHHPPQGFLAGHRPGARASGPNASTGRADLVGLQTALPARHAAELAALLHEAALQILICTEDSSAEEIRIFHEDIPAPHIRGVMKDEQLCEPPQAHGKIIAPIVESALPEQHQEDLEWVPLYLVVGHIPWDRHLHCIKDPVPSHVERVMYVDQGGHSASLQNLVRQSGHSMSSVSPCRGDEDNASLPEFDEGLGLLLVVRQPRLVRVRYLAKHLDEPERK